METKEIEHYFANSTILQENGEDTEELINLAGYQVTKAELFAHTRERNYHLGQQNQVQHGMPAPLSWGDAYPDSHPSGAEKAYNPPMRPGCAGLSTLGERRWRKRAFQSGPPLQDIRGKSF